MATTQHPDLARWHRLLDDAGERMRNPTTHYRAVQAEAEQLLARRVITEGDFHELADLADAAYLHAQEELASEPFEPGAVYDLIEVSTGERAGVVTRGTLLFSDPARRRTLSPVDGLVRYNDQGELCMVQMDGRSLGRIRSLVWVGLEGAAFYLLKAKSYSGGELVPHLWDVDACRLALDRLALAREEGDATAIRWLQQALAVAPFGLCQVCRDRFELVDDCAACSGVGIVSRGGSR